MSSTVVAERLEQLLVDGQNRIFPLGNKAAVKMYASYKDGHLSLEMRSPQPSYLPDFIEGTHGIHVEVDKGNETLGPRVIFTSKDNDLNIVFFSLADNLCTTVERSESELEAVSSALARFEEFREMMQGERKNLSQEATRGLIAEHLVLLDYLKDPSNDYQKLIRSWQGPFGGNKDFVFGGQGFEVKSIRPNATTIKVANTDQLDPNGLDLYLLTFCLDQVQHEAPGTDLFSLRSLVNRVKDILAVDRNARNQYLIALAQTGYTEEENGHADVLYRLQKRTAYAVGNQFPKITAIDVPVGVEDLTYSVKISSIQQFEREMDEINIDL